MNPIYEVEKTLTNRGILQLLESIKNKYFPTETIITYNEKPKGSELF